MSHKTRYTKCGSLKTVRLFFTGDRDRQTRLERNSKKSKVKKVENQKQKK